MNAATPAVTLAWLLDGIAILPANEVRVLDLALDSRHVQAGSLFFALPGRTAHGLDYAAEAAARGASAVLWDPEGSAGPANAIVAAAAGVAAETDSAPPVDSAPAADNVTTVDSVPFAAPIAGLRHLVGRIADRFFGQPSAHLRVVGITGTNGKTTCAYLLAQCLGRLGVDAAYIGTLGWGRVDALNTPTHTTPDVLSVHRQLAHLRALGVQDVAMEVSSHALDQGRVDGVRFDSAAFTNLTRDHLDYHATLEAYGAAKARLFAVPGLQHRVVNVGDAFGLELAMRPESAAPLTAVWVGADDSGPRGGRFIRGDDVVAGPHGMSLEVSGSFGRRRVTTRLFGRFNAENAVVVIGLLIGLGVPLEDAAAALAECTAPPGRMELIESLHPGKPAAVIDYAHTPDALAKALQAVREHAEGAVWCVFGCGGDRDPGKRPLMGAVADEYADQVIVTDDNPRTEDPETICRAIVRGITSREVRIIHDRSAAIATALREAAAADIVLIAGKGHEEYQIYGDARRRFSDRHEAERYLGAAA